MRQIERDIGTKELNILMLQALRDALVSCKLPTVESLRSQMAELIHTFNNTEPRFAVVIYSMYHVYEEICRLIDEKEDHHPLVSYRKDLVNIINRLIERLEKDTEQILRNVEKIKVDDKTILIHDHSRTVQSVLAHLKKKGRTFRVLVAEQDMEKTLSNIEFLSSAKIPFQVVPAHMLSNAEDEVDMCFFGALTLKNTYDFVVDTGTNAIISEFHLQHVPIYFFLSSAKFSLWKSKKKEKIARHIHTRKHPSKKIHFERFKFSHDRVPLVTVDYTVTEEGIFDAHGLKKLYQGKFEAQAALMKEIEKI